MKAKPKIRNIAAASAHDFVGALRGTAPHWTGGQRDRWVFRGQRDARWSLVPSALRRGTRLSYTNKSVIGPEGDTWKQAWLESRLAREFLVKADRIGLPVPGDSYLLRSDNAWNQVVDSAIAADEWPPDVVLDLLAIAQHHGVPTRLLDFSHSSMKAAYFAASGAVSWLRAPRKRDRPPKTARFAVWALSIHELFFIHEEGDRSLQVVAVPRAQNPFLHAQDGVFVTDRNAHVAGNAPTPMDKLLLHWQQERRASGALKQDEHLILLVTAPVTEAEGVLSLLQDEGVDEASLMPSYDNVVRYLERRRDGL